MISKRSHAGIYKYSVGDNIILFQVILVDCWKGSHENIIMCNLCLCKCYAKHKILLNLFQFMYTTMNY